MFRFLGILQSTVNEQSVPHCTLSEQRIIFHKPVLAIPVMVVLVEERIDPVKGGKNHILGTRLL